MHRSATTHNAADRRTDSAVECGSFVGLKIGYLLFWAENAIAYELETFFILMVFRTKNVAFQLKAIYLKHFAATFWRWPWQQGVDESLKIRQTTLALRLAIEFLDDSLWKSEAQRVFAWSLKLEELLSLEKNSAHCFESIPKIPLSYLSCFSFWISHSARHQFHILYFFFNHLRLLKTCVNKPFNCCCIPWLCVGDHSFPGQIFPNFAGQFGSLPNYTAHRHCGVLFT